MKNYSTDITKKLLRHLRKANTQGLAFHPQTGTIEFLQPGHGQIPYYSFEIQVSKKRYTVKLRCPVTPAPGDAEATASIAKYLSLINQTKGFGFDDGHLEGYFDLNCSNGLIEYEFFVDCYMRLAQDVIRMSLDWPVVDMDRVIPGVLDILFRGVSPDEAMEAYRQRIEIESTIPLRETIA